MINQFKDHAANSWLVFPIRMPIRLIVQDQSVCLFILEDFSDYNDEDEDDVGETIIVKGVQGECKDNGEGNYRYVWLYVCMSVCSY